MEKIVKFIMIIVAVVMAASAEAQSYTDTAMTEAEIRQHLVSNPNDTICIPQGEGMVKKYFVNKGRVTSRVDRYVTVIDTVYDNATLSALRMADIQSRAYEKTKRGEVRDQHYYQVVAGADTFKVIDRATNAYNWWIGPQIGYKVSKDFSSPIFGLTGGYDREHWFVGWQANAVRGQYTEYSAHAGGSYWAFNSGLSAGANLFSFGRMKTNIVSLYAGVQFTAYVTDSPEKVLEDGSILLLQSSGSYASPEVGLQYTMRLHNNPQGLRLRAFLTWERGIIQNQSNTANPSFGLSAVWFWGLHSNRTK